MSEFNLREFLTENKLTALSRVSPTTDSTVKYRLNESPMAEKSREELLSIIGMTESEALYLEDEKILELAMDIAGTGLNESLEETEEANVNHYLAMESPDQIIKELENEVSKVTLEAKMRKLKEIIETFDYKINSLEEDSELAGFVNTSKLKEMKRTVKKLRSMDEKYVKEYDKKYNKEEK